MIDYGANRWRESWNSIPQGGGGSSIYNHGSFGGGSFTLGQTLAQSDPLKYRPGYFDRGKGEWMYFDELARQYYYNKSSPYWGTSFVQVKADMGEYVRWVRDFGVQSTRIYLDAWNKGSITDMTEAFNRQIANIYYTMKYLGEGLGPADRLLLIKDLAGKTGGIWDFKNRPDSPFHSSNMGAFGLYRGMKMAPDDFGNYGFGVALNAMDINVTLATFIVGFFPNSERTWWNLMGGFDEAKDTGFIRLGYRNARF